MAQSNATVIESLQRALAAETLRGDRLEASLRKTSEERDCFLRLWKLATGQPT